MKKLLLILVLLITVAAFGLPVKAAEPTSSEVIGLRDQYSNTYDMGDGSYRTIIQIGSVNFETLDGKFYPIQTNILASSKPDWDWEVTSGHWQLYVKNDTTVGVRKNDNWIATRLHGIAYLNIVTKNYTILQVTGDVTPTVNGNRLTWEGIMYGVDYTIHYTNDSLKEIIIIKQEARDLLSSSGYRPSDFGYPAKDTFLVPIFECDWSQSLPMRLSSCNSCPVDTSAAEVEETIYFESPIKDKYFDTNLVSFLPLDYAVSENPINPNDPEKDWVYAKETIRKRLVRKNGKDWLLAGVPVLSLNQMPAGSIIFDPTEQLTPNAAGDECSIGDFERNCSDCPSHYTCISTANDDKNFRETAGDYTWYRDLYNIPSHSTGSGTINKITVSFRWRTEADNLNRARASIKSNSTVTDGGAKTAPVYPSWANSTQDWTTNPADSQPWEWADIDALQVGVSLYGESGYYTECDYVSMSVDYTPPPPPDPPTNVLATDGNYSDKVVITWTKSDGATKYEVFQDDVGLGELGDVATHDDSTADVPTITAGTANASDGTSTAHVTLSLAGESANDGTTHTYNVSAWSATGGWSDNSTTNTGFCGVGELTYQWQRSGADSDANYSNIVGATTDPYNDTDAPSDGSGRYFKCVLDATGATQQTSTADRGYRLAIPTIITDAATYVEYSTAQLNSTLTNDGGEGCEIRFQYNTSTDNWTQADNTTWGDNYTTGSHPYAGITSLLSATTYYFRAQAKNTVGTANGTALSFATENDVLEPINFKAFPDAEQMVLSWTKQSGATSTHIRYKEATYPTGTSDGILVYSGELGTCTHAALTPGHSYYYSAWGLSGTTYSENYTMVMATTLALPAVGDTPEAPATPPTWFQTPDYTNFAALPFFDIINAFFDAYEMPRASGWFFSTIIGCMVFAILVFILSKHPVPAMIALAVALALASLIKLLPMWMMAFTVIFMLGAFQLGRAR